MAGLSAYEGSYILGHKIGGNALVLSHVAGPLAAVLCAYIMWKILALTPKFVQHQPKSALKQLIFGWVVFISMIAWIPLSGIITYFILKFALSFRH